MDKLILVPLMISAAFLLTREPRDVFILVFLPSLTLLPSYFDVELVSGTPELYFWSAALIPILMAWAMRNFENLNFHWIDFVILGYILFIFLGQWSNSDYKQAQKVMFNKMMAIYFPYILVRAFCEDRETIIKMVTMMTILGAIIAVFNMYEFRFFTNYFDQLLRRIWPHWVVWDTGMVMRRWGFKRVFGPFSHPIVCGYFFSFITPLSIWCYFQNHYRNKRIGKIIVILNITGVVTSLSRAPMIGCVIGLGIIYFGYSSKKALIGTILGILTGILLMVAIPKFIEYASVTRATAKTVDQRNVAYRKEMWEAYIDVVLERPYLGWGKFSVPTIKGMESIDSEYLGVSLSSGVIVLFFYLTYLIAMLVRLFLFAIRRAHDDPWSRLAWCIIAGWCSAIFTQGTVYSGAQTVQYLFMIGGLGQVILLTSPFWSTQKKETPEVNYIGHGFRFARVI